MRWLLLLGALLLSLAASATLGPFDSMVMPGEVTKAHEKLEKECSNCHVPFRKSAQKGLCLDCHDHAAVAEDIAGNRGYHGRLKDQTCSRCHTEHKGRGVNIVRLDDKTFDHALTDFPLRGKHADVKVKCVDCHAPKRKHRDAPSECYACHKKDDAHKGGLGKDCVSCHEERDWKKVRFDHSKTGYPLEGKHLQATCASCHVNERYKNTPKDCYSCHRADDRKKGHKGRFGNKCETCHLPDSWKRASRFDHNRDTRYPLIGRHREVKCTACHTGDLYKDKLKTACVSCHQRDDKHKTRFGTKCESCHVEKDWKRITFDHARHTRYPLRGKHADVECVACHKGTLYREKLKTECLSCHRKDDVHKGQEGPRCEQCHNERAWKQATFDHGLTRFPLLGKHKSVACKECHAKPTFKDASSECGACHRKDDAHKRKLGLACGQCHNAADWKRWTFDHNKRTHFALDGGHEGLACTACHTKAGDRIPGVSTACVSCHAWDDVHDGAFGRFCEQCHVTSSFKEIQAGFRRLKGSQRR